MIVTSLSIFNKHCYLSLLIQPHRLQVLLPYFLCQPLRLQDFDVRASGEQRCVEVGGYAQDVFKIGPVFT